MVWLLPAAAGRRAAAPIAVAELLSRSPNRCSCCPALSEEHASAGRRAAPPRKPVMNRADARESRSGRHADASSDRCKMQRAGGKNPAAPNAAEGARAVPGWRRHRRTLTTVGELDTDDAPARGVLPEAVEQVPWLVEHTVGRTGRGRPGISVPAPDK